MGRLLAIMILSMFSAGLILIQATSKARKHGSTVKVKMVRLIMQDENTLLLLFPTIKKYLLLEIMIQGLLQTLSCLIWLH